MLPDLSSLSYTCPRPAPSRPSRRTRSTWRSAWDSRMRIPSSRSLLLKDQMVCVMRNDHPLAIRPLSLSDFLEAKHLKVSMSPTDLRFVDDVLAQQGLTRRVALNVPHWLLVPHVL